MPACTPFTGTPAMRSASSTARWIEATVFSRSTTTPRRSPSLGVLPTPTMLSSFGVFFSAMMHEIFVVPMSSPTYVLVAWAIRLTSCARTNVLDARRRRSSLTTHRVVRSGGSNDHLVLVAHVDFVRRHSLVLEVGEHDAQR